MDKIYSRRRIKIPKIKHTPKNKLNFLIYACIIILICSIVGAFIKAAYPIFIASCKSAAASKVTNIVNEEIESLMNYYTYSELVTLEKDSQGKVTLLQTNTILMNQIIAKLTKNIQARIDSMPTIMVYINYGSVSGISKLKWLGPRFEIELEAAGKIDTEVISDFKSVGVNQTLHMIYLKMDSKVGILTPFGSFGKDISSKVLMTEAIIVGEVPETYYHLEGMTEDDTLNVLE